MGGHVAGTHGRSWHAACILSRDAGLAGNFREHTFRAEIREGPPGGQAALNLATDRVKRTLNHGPPSPVYAVRSRHRFTRSLCPFSADGKKAQTPSESAVSDAQKVCSEIPKSEKRNKLRAEYLEEDWHAPLFNFTSGRESTPPRARGCYRSRRVANPALARHSRSSTCL